VPSDLQGKRYEYEQHTDIIVGGLPTPTKYYLYVATNDKKREEDAMT